MSRIDRRTIYYWDTSALIKRYARERGTMEVSLVLDGPINTHWIATVVGIEVHTTLNKQVQDGRISRQQRNIAVSEFITDAANRPYLSIDIINADWAEAIRLAAIRPLTGAGDSLIVAAGLRVFKTMQSDLVWVTCDRLMRETANAEGFDVYDPEWGKFYQANGSISKVTPA